LAEAILIGRDPEQCKIVINDPYVSRVHLQIVKDEQGVFHMLDLDSRCGTFVNGKIVKTAILKSTDIIRIGNTAIPWRNYFIKGREVFSYNKITEAEKLNIETGDLPDSPHNENACDLSNIKIVNAVHLDNHEIIKMLNSGARLVRYRYCVSFILLSFRINSPVYLNADGANDLAKKYNRISRIYGWWAIPLGPIFTAKCVKTNNSGGIDVTSNYIQTH